MPIENQEESATGSKQETDAGTDKTRVMPVNGSSDSSDSHGEDATRVMLPPDDKTEVAPVDELYLPLEQATQVEEDDAPVDDEYRPLEQIEQLPLPAAA